MRRAAPALLDDCSGAEGRSAPAARSGHGAWRRSAARASSDALIRLARRSESADSRRGASIARAARSRRLRDRFCRASMPMPHWTVRAALASVLGTLTPEAGLPRLRAMLDDPEPRVDSAGARRAREAAPAGRRADHARAAERRRSGRFAPPQPTRLRELKPPSGVGGAGRRLPAR